MSPLWKSLALIALIAGVPSARTSAADLEWVRVSDDGKGFVKSESGKPFIPWGFNYDHEGDGKLLEDYWDEQWSTVESAFQEMHELGANVVRIHLQFGTFMESPNKPRQHSLDQLSRLVKLAEQTGLYLDVTGLGCYHKPDVPAWYDKLSEQERWAAQAVFWEAVAKTCSESSAIFCYDLMNEPVVPGGDKQRDDWLGPGFGDKYFVQFIALDRKGRDRPDVALQWIRQLVSAVRKHDKRHLITVGLVPWSLDRPGMTSGFVPEKIADDLDFIAMHIYPEKGKIDEAIETVKGFAAVGKPVVIEETFVLKCGADELEEFIDRSRAHATGWIGFYWGSTPEEIRPAKTLPEAFTLSWLELFQKKRTSILDASLPKVTIREIDGPIDHNHCTTRQFQHMSFHHEGVWFVFYSDGKNFRYQTSNDSGKSWKPADEPIASAPNGSSSFDVLKVGDTVYISHAHYPLGRYDANAPYAKDPARRAEYTHEGRMRRGRIEGRRIKWLQDVNVGFTPDYCNMVRDSEDFFWVFTREDQMGTVHRSRKRHDIQSWEPKSICLPLNGRHALDAAALDDGKLYSVSLLTTDGKLYGNLYDGENWGDSPVLIADNLTTVAGDDRRLAVEFDPTQKRLHLIYVDAGNRLRYRHLDSPYRPSDWQPALSAVGTEIASGVFTAALSVDSSSRPYGLVVAYGIEKHLGQDRRRRTGELYARRFDGQNWQSDPLLVSQPGTFHNWYPNVNQDAKDGICVLYSRSMDQDNLGVPLAVMTSLVADFSVTGSQPASFLDNGVTAHRGNSGEYPENQP